MKYSKKIATLVLASCVCYNADASSQGKFYVGFEGGGSILLKSKTCLEHKSTKPGLLPAGTPIKIATKNKGGGAFGFKIGYNFYDNISLELAYNILKRYEMNATEIKPLPDPKGQSVLSYNTIMANLVYRVNTESNIKPYFLIGAGMMQFKRDLKFVSIIHPMIGARTDVTNVFTEELGNKVRKINGMAFNVGAGVDCNLNDHIALYAAGRIDIARDIKVYFKKQAVGSATLLAGLKFSF